MVILQVILVFKRTFNNCITWINAFSICLFYIYHCGVKKIVFFSIIIGLKRIEKLNHPKPKGFDLQFFAAPPNHFILNCKKFLSMHIQHSTDDSATCNCFAVSLLELIKFRQVTALTLNPTGKKTNFKYILSVPVDCKWSNWSPCSKSCGTGEKTRTIQTPPENCGNQCSGPSRVECNTQSCTGTLLYIPGVQ